MSDVASMISDSISRFSLRQEIEFTTAAYCLWLPPRKGWTNRFGEYFTFDDLAKILLSRTWGEGSCRGAHVPFAMVYLLRAHEVHSILSVTISDKLRSRLKEISQLLNQNQLDDGAWSSNWTSTQSTSHEPEATGSLIQQFTVTGHHLEWIMHAPTDLRPEPGRISRAADWTSRFAELCSSMTIRGTYGPFSHAGRAIFFASLDNKCLVSGELDNGRKVQ